STTLIAREFFVRNVGRRRRSFREKPAFHPPKWTGTVRVRTPPPKSGGGAGTGLARRGSETASASSAGLPDEPIRRAASTWPDRAMVKATDAVPVLAAPDGYRLYRFRWAINSLFQ